MRAGWLVVLSACWALSGPQGGQGDGRRVSHPPRPTRPTPPARRSPLAPVPEPYRSPVDRRDLLQRYGPSSPLEGVWELRRIVGPGSTIGGPGIGVESSGYLMIGRRHLSLQLFAPAAGGGTPRIQTSFRNYTVRGNQLVMTSKIGFGNDEDGDIVLSKAGARELRRFEHRGGFLRIHRSGGGVLEFERIE